MVFGIANIIYRFLSDGDAYVIGWNSDFVRQLTRWLMALLASFGGGYTASDVANFDLSAVSIRYVLAMVSFVFALIVSISILNLIFKFIKYLVYYIGGLFRI